MNNKKFCKIALSYGGGGVQLSPAMFLPGVGALPKAVKHIYSRLAAAATDLDQGVPELVLSLISGPGSAMDFEVGEKISKIIITNKIIKLQLKIKNNKIAEKYIHI